MSIQETLHKIKRGFGAYNFMPIYLFIIAGVGFSSFFLGRLSVEESTVKSESVSITKREGMQTSANSTTIKKVQTKVLSSNAGGGKYVASKNGKLYYTASCKGANRIKEENKVWFDTADDAEKLGYTWATSCK